MKKATSVGFHFLTLYSTGVRRAELCALKVADMQFDEHKRV